MDPEYLDATARSIGRCAIDRPTRELRLDVTDDELAELERALLKARATELGEVRRRDVRFTAGYSDATTREVLDDEGRRAQLRYEVLSKLIDHLRRHNS